MRLASTKIAQPEPSRRSALLSRAVVPTSSAGVAESRSGPRNRAVRWKLPSLLRITPGATSAAHGKKSASILGFLRYSARFSMATALHAKMRRIAEVSAHDVDELRVAPCGPDRRHVPDRPQQEAGDPQTKSQSDDSRQGAVSDRDRAGRAAKQDRLRQGAMDGRFEPGNRIVGQDLAHQTTAPTGERAKRQEERTRRKRDGEAEHDLDEAAEPAGGVAKGKRQSGDDDDDHCHNFRDWAFDRLQDLLQRLLPRHVRTSGVSWCGRNFKQQGSKDGRDVVTDMCEQPSHAFSPSASKPDAVDTST